MKKITAFLIFAILAASSVCMAQGQKVPVSADKILVVYYSWGGNTKVMAEEIARQTGGIIFEINPVKAYPKNFKQCKNVARGQVRKGVKPKLKAIPDIEKYDVIFVGSPNWFGTMAPPVRTLVSETAFAGKTVLPFFTHGGGGMQRCESDIRKIMPDSKLLPALTLPGRKIRNCKKEISDWIKKQIRITK